MGYSTLRAPKGNENVTENPDVMKEVPFKAKIIWPNLIFFAVIHIAGLYGIYLIFFGAKALTTAFGFIVGLYSGLGITMGAHRLWAHRSFKAKLPLRLALLIAQTVAGQNCLWVWVRDHRQHHKYTDTDADPHNSRRGFFFSHMGWLMMQKHPEVKTKGKLIDMSDLDADPYVRFQKRYFKPIYFFVSFFVPVFVPCYFWNETLWNSFFVSYIFRFVLSLNSTWCVNSVAHIFGTRPYDKNILPVESSFVSFVAIGEGWHNYHHVFPWDCNASEYGPNRLNLTSRLLSLLEYVGLAYDLKKATKEMIINRVKKHGDGTHAYY